MAIVLGWSAVASAQAWEEAPDLDNVVVYGVAADLTDPDVLLAGGGGKGGGCAAADKVDGCDVYRSTNGGVSFAVATGAVNRIDLRAVAIAGANGVAASLDAGEGDKVLHSGDGGATWATVETGTDIGETEMEIAIDPTTPATMYLGDFQLGDWTVGDAYILKSVNGGADWAHVPETTEPGGELRAYALEVDPTDGNVVWVAGSGTPYIARSANGGATWPSAEATGMDQISSLAIDPNDNATVFAGTIQDGVYRTENGGTDWTLGLGAGLPASPPEGRVTEMIVHPFEADTVYAATLGGGVFVSTDNGASFTAMNDGLASAALTVHDMALTADSKLFIGTDDGAYLFVLDPDPPAPDAGVPDAGGITADAGSDEPDAGGTGGNGEDGGGCGCRTGGRTAGGGLALLLLGAAVLLWLRSRRGDWDTRPD